MLALLSVGLDRLAVGLVCVSATYLVCCWILLPDTMGGAESSICKVIAQPISSKPYAQYGLPFCASRLFRRAATGSSAGAKASDSLQTDDCLITYRNHGNCTSVDGEYSPSVMYSLASQSSS